MGAKVIVISEQGHSIQGMMDTPIFDKKPMFTDEEWSKLAEGLNKLGELAQEKDMKVVYHHHMGTGVQTTEEIDKLMEMTNPNLVYLLFDTGHLVFSGEEHLAVLKKYVNRIKHVHLKDIRAEVVEEVKEKKMSFLQAVKAGAFTVPGDGSIDFEPVFKVLAENNYEGYLLVEAEQDPAKANPLEYAIKARKYIREKAGI
jgi:inosose dehydratase